MSTTTTKFGLIKPNIKDPADITLMNENWEILERVLTNFDTLIASNANYISRLDENAQYHIAKKAPIHLYGTEEPLENTSLEEGQLLLIYE